MTRVVFVPLPLPAARRLRSGEPVGATGCAVTPRLRAELGAGEEEAEFAALSNAGVLALTAADPPRLVLAAMVDSGQVTERPGELGLVEVGGLAWAQVSALFADEPAAAQAAGAARAAAAGLELAAALDRPEVGTLLDRHDLLWFSPEELDALG